MSIPESPQTKETTIGINNAINSTVTHYSNVDQHFITITEDKVDIILRDHLKEIKAKTAWETPLGILVSLIIALTTVDKFKNAFYIPATSWQTIIYLAGAISLVWLLYSFVNGYKNRRTSIKSIIEAMKKTDSNSSIISG